MFLKTLKIINLFLIVTITLLLLNSCGIYRRVEAKDYPPEPDLRVRKNIEEGRGFKILTGDNKGGKFNFNLSQIIKISSPFSSVTLQVTAL